MTDRTALVALIRAAEKEIAEANEKEEREELSKALRWIVRDASCGVDSSSAGVYYHNRAVALKLRNQYGLDAHYDDNGGISVRQLRAWLAGDKVV